MQNVFVLLSITAGAGLAAQVVINAELRATTQSAMWAAIIQFLQLKLRIPAFSEIWKFARDGWQISRWLLAGNLATAGNSTLYTINFRFWWGAQVIGIAFALNNLLRLTNPLMFAIISLITPHVARTRAANTSSRLDFPMPATPWTYSASGPPSSNSWRRASTSRARPAKAASARSETMSPSFCITSPQTPPQSTAFVPPIPGQSPGLKLYVPSQCQWSPSVGGATSMLALKNVNFPVPPEKVQRPRPVTRLT